MNKLAIAGLCFVAGSVTVYLDSRLALREALANVDKMVADTAAAHTPELSSINTRMYVEMMLAPWITATENRIHIPGHRNEFLAALETAIRKHA